LSKLQRDQLQKFAQYLISELPQQILPTAQKLLDELLKSNPIAAQACDPAPIALRAGTQELLISPGPAFIVDGAQLDGPLAAEITTAPTTPAQITGWTSDRRTIEVTRSPITRIVVVPESVNSGWVAHTPDGATLTPVIVNGWQQGWVVPAGAQGTITVSFESNSIYRAGLIGGLALLPLLLLLALIPARRPVSPEHPAVPWSPVVTAVIGLVAAGAVIAGVGGIAVFSAALITAYLLRRRRHLLDRLTLAVAPAGLILAGALLARYPWRSVDGYIGHSAWVQLPALVAVAALAASVLPEKDHSTTAAP
jgi:arabinofuranan 3-O-arabinosyltransferase